MNIDQSSSLISWRANIPLAFPAAVLGPAGCQGWLWTLFVCVTVNAKSANFISSVKFLRTQPKLTTPIYKCYQPFYHYKLMMHSCEQVTWSYRGHRVTFPPKVTYVHKIIIIFPYYTLNQKPPHPHIT